MTPNSTRTPATWKPRLVSGEGSRGAVVVGVDGSAGNRAAVEYAAREAAAGGRPLTLLLVANDYDVPVPHHSWRRDDSPAWQALTGLRSRILEVHPDVDIRCEIQAGSTAWWLLERSRSEEELVVGRRGLGPFGRLLLGSTSLTVAGRSAVPVVVVPTDWEAERHSHDPVVVGLDPTVPHIGALLAYAFRTATRRGAALRIVHALDLNPPPDWDHELVASVRRHWSERRAAELTAILRPFELEHPTVATELVQWAGQPAGAVMSNVEDAQLLVVGRRHTGRAAFGLGSTSRAVLHRARLPVAVIPTPFRPGPTCETVELPPDHGRQAPTRRAP